MQLRDDTIVALSTAPGRGAIAIIRLSGTQAHAIVARLSRRWAAEPRIATLATLIDPRDGAPLDQAVITRYVAPYSYTGEDMVEISCHGGLASTTGILDALQTQGARLADPGEFTRRAVLHGKLDVLQAEAIADLVDAETTAGRTLALSQLAGHLSGEIDDLRRSVVHLEALLTYELDFPGEDDGPIPAIRINEAADALTAKIAKLLATAPLAGVAEAGARVVIAGAPNVGKSSLFNALLGTPRAIVTEFPGTTRDAIEARLDTGRWPIRLVDTAGLRDTHDLIERLGIEVSEAQVADAHLVLACSDTVATLPAILHTISQLTKAPLIAVRTKADQAPGEQPPAPDVVAVSSRTREGLDRLTALIAQRLDDTLGSVPVDRPVLTRTRHRMALERAFEELRLFREAWSTPGMPSVIAAVHVRSASTALDELIGSVDVDDVLDAVFRTFCIGK